MTVTEFYDQFFAIAKDSFNFLVKEYGFVFNSTGYQYHDQWAYVRFDNQGEEIDIMMGGRDERLEVVIHINQSSGRTDHIKLSNLVETNTSIFSFSLFSYNETDLKNKLEQQGLWLRKLHLNKRAN